MSKLYRPKTAANPDVQMVEYPVNPALPRYNAVPICNVGNHRPWGWFGNGGIFRPDRAYFEDLVANYDPSWFVATLNLDHLTFSWWSDDPLPTAGLITGLSVSGEGDDAQLLADVASLDPELADQIDQGRWPNRSMEWVDAYDDLEWLQSRLPPDEVPPLEALLFYERFARYFVGLAGLGLSWPAVVGLGPWPAQTQAAAEPELVKLPPAARIVEARPRAASLSTGPRVHSLISTPAQEGTPMAEKAVATAKGSPPAEGGSEQAATAAASTQTVVEPDTELTPASTEPAGAQASTTGDAALQAELRAERQAREHLEQVVAAQHRSGEIKARLQTHVRSGRLTAQPQREAYLRLASQLYGVKPPLVMQASGEPLQLEVAPLDDLDAIIREFPASATFQLVADEEPGASDSDKNPAATQRSEAVKEAGRRMGVDSATNGEGGEQ